MQHHSIARGRKKEVEKFKTKQGLSIIGWLMLLGMLLLLLYSLGFLHFDVD
jgi:hypothetical protein